MFLNQRNNGFILTFPNNFFSKEIDEKYEKYYKNLMLPFEKSTDFLSFTVQGIDFLGFDMQTIQQVRNLGKIQDYKNARPTPDLFERKFTITFRLSDGWLNYFMFLDNAINYLKPENISPSNNRNSLGTVSNPPAPDTVGQVFNPFYLTILNDEGYAIATLRFEKPIWTGFSGLDFNYTNVQSKTKTFTATFKYFKFDIDYHFDD